MHTCIIQSSTPELVHDENKMTVLICMGSCCPELDTSTGNDLGLVFTLILIDADEEGNWYFGGLDQDVP